MERLERNTIVTAALARLAEYNILLNREKCLFVATSTVFLGHRLSEKGIEPMEDKIKAIKSFRQPTSAEEVRSFLGLVNFTAKFIPNVATLSEPLRRLTKSTVPFEWGHVQREAFEKLKDAMMKPTFLGYATILRIVHRLSPMQAQSVWAQFWCNMMLMINRASFLSHTKASPIRKNDTLRLKRRHMLWYGQSNVTTTIYSADVSNW